MLQMATDDVEVELEEMGLDISAADPVARKRTLVRFRSQVDYWWREEGAVLADKQVLK